IDLVPPNLKRYITKEIDNCFSSPARSNFEVKISDSLWLKANLVPMNLSDDSNPMMIIIEDISQRVLTEIKVKANENKFHKLIENISDTILLLNEKFEIEFQSPNCTLFGVTKNLPHAGINILELIHPNDLFEFNALLIRSFQAYPEALSFQARILQNQEHYIWIEGSLKNLLQQTNVGSIVINFRDITQRKSAEQELIIAKLKAEQSAKKLSLAAMIIESSEDAIISKNLDGIITSWNTGAANVFGYSADEIIGKNGSILMEESHTYEESLFIEKLFAGESIKQFETKRLTKDGRSIYVSISISAIYDNTGKIIGLSKVLRDVTDKKVLEKERLAVLEDLIQRNRELEQFSFIVSHNLRAPVANIIGVSDLLSTESIDIDVYAELLKGLNKSAHALDVVIRDLNYILQKKREVNESHTKVYFADLVNEIKLSLDGIIKEENVVFDINFSAYEHIETVKSYLYSIFYNLISNSIKYRKPDTTPVLEIKSQIQEAKLVLTFKDNGLGIDLAKKGDQLFMLYKRFHFHKEGKGMGLFMVKSQVESLGGKISVSSEVNKGTEFSLSFPIST
ncbi:MAG: PAS domain S-box protein, partial [Bacteroidia bacterium]|nr:PAS domain S-box protein [Bacteroidia bacterium]